MAVWREGRGYLEKWRNQDGGKVKRMEKEGSGMMRKCGGRRRREKKGA